MDNRKRINSSMTYDEYVDFFELPYVPEGH